MVVCPTCVGMNRKTGICGVQGSPVCPTCVGMNRASGKISSSALAVCPTCVGMNRGFRTQKAALEYRLPHVRGDEPAI